MDNANTLQRSRPDSRGRARDGRTVVVMVVVLIVAAASVFVAIRVISGRSSAAAIARADIRAATAISPLRGRIVQLAEEQVGYATDPANTYCNTFSAYWDSGPANCGNGNRREEWCADFAAWVWRKAGAEVVYQYINGDLNASSASFYEWGVAHGTWHPVSSGYVPQPGDVAVYGLDAATLVAQHVAVVVSDTPGSRGPDVVNGDGNRTGFSVVEVGNDQYRARVPGVTAYLSGYVSPTSP
jgi:CHAP domain